MSDGATIFALASGRGRAGIAVVRLSGPRAGDALTRLTRQPLPPPRTARLVRLRDPADEAPLDDALTLWFPGPASFTGEDMVELHLHGGPAVVTGVLDALGRIDRLRAAEPGEFSRRAFLSGKLDLTAIEGLADLVAADTVQQRRQALDQMAGRLGALYEGWRGRLLRLLAAVEAEIDFGEEEGDVGAGAGASLAHEIPALAAEIAAHLADENRGERLRDGLQVAIVGPPNAGKSSLLNALARRDVAIVAAVPGTTRDVLEVRLDLSGYPLILADTAGLRAGGDEIEAEGVRRARGRAAAADLRLLVIDAAAPPELGDLGFDVDGDTLVLANKVDLAPTPDVYGGRTPISLSLRDGRGLDEVVSRLEGEAARRLASSSAPVISRARHRGALEACIRALGRAEAAEGDDLAAEDLRLAGYALGRITGRVDVEDILDIVFAEFCIGK